MGLEVIVSKRAGSARTRYALASASSPPSTGSFRMRSTSFRISVTAGPVVPLFNLDVARNRTFFVGRHDALVHDNTPPDPRLEPFDAGASLAVSAQPKREAF